MKRRELIKSSKQEFSALDHESDDQFFSGMARARKGSSMKGCRPQGVSDFKEEDEQRTLVLEVNDGEFSKLSNTSQVSQLSNKSIQPANQKIVARGSDLPDEMSFQCGRNYASGHIGDSGIESEDDEMNFQSSEINLKLSSKLQTVDYLLDSLVKPCDLADRDVLLKKQRSECDRPFSLQVQKASNSSEVEQSDGFEADQKVYPSPPLDIIKKEVKPPLTSPPKREDQPLKPLNIFNLKRISEGGEEERKSSDHSESLSSHDAAAGPVGTVDTDLTPKQALQHLKHASEFWKISTEELDQLQEQLHSNKIFLNMVVHDMRNPTVSSKLGLSATLENLKKIRSNNESTLGSVEDLAGLVDRLQAKSPPSSASCKCCSGRRNSLKSISSGQSPKVGYFSKVSCLMSSLEESTTDLRLTTKNKLREIANCISKCEVNLKTDSDEESGSSHRSLDDESNSGSKPNEDSQSPEQPQQSSNGVIIEENSSQEEPSRPSQRVISSPSKPSSSRGSSFQQIIETKECEFEEALIDEYGGDEPGSSQARAICPHSNLMIDQKKEKALGSMLEALNIHGIALSDGGLDMACVNSMNSDQRKPSNVHMRSSFNLNEYGLSQVETLDLIVNDSLHNYSQRYFSEDQVASMLETRLSDQAMDLSFEHQLALQTLRDKHYKELDSLNSKLKKVEQQKIELTPPPSKDAFCQTKPVHVIADGDPCFLLTNEAMTLIESRVREIEDQINEVDAKIIEGLSCFRGHSDKFKSKVNNYVTTASEIQKKLLTTAQITSDHLIVSESLLQKQLISQSMMENLVNDLLDLAKQENGAFNLEMEQFDLAQTIREAFSILMHQAVENKIKLQATIDSLQNIPLIQCLHGDKRRFMQILLNFLSNSLKFTETNGTVRIGIEIKEKQLRKSSKSSENASSQHKSSSSSLLVESYNETQEYYVAMEITIEDTGIGISEEGISKLFIDFNKLSENSKMNRSGTGLGLSICKKIIELMGGSVRVESKINEGTKFIISVNTKCWVEGGDLSSEGLGTDQKMKEEFMLLNQGNSTSSYNFILKEATSALLKTCLPDESEEEDHASNEVLVGSSTKKQRRPDSPARLSSDDPSSDKKLVTQFTFNDRNTQLKKNMREEDLPRFGLGNEDQVMRLEQKYKSAVSRPSLTKKNLHKRRKQKSQRNLSIAIGAPQGFSDSVACRRLNKKKPRYKKASSKGISAQMAVSPTLTLKPSVLVANDDPMQLHVLQTMFTQFDFEVSTAQNGFQAFEQVKASMDHGLDAMFDLVVLDLNMPISDGYDASKKISSLYEQKKILEIEDSRKDSDAHHSIVLHEDISVSSYFEKVSCKQRIKLKNTELKPLIVAVTSYIDESIVKRTAEAGFQLTLLTPLARETIEHELIPRLHDRHNKIRTKVKLIEQFEKNYSPGLVSQKNSSSSLITSNFSNHSQVVQHRFGGPSKFLKRESKRNSSSQSNSQGPIKRDSVIRSSITSNEKGGSMSVLIVQKVPDYNEE